MKDELNKDMEQRTSADENPAFTVKQKSVQLRYHSDIGSFEDGT